MMCHDRNCDFIDLDTLEGTSMATLSMCANTDGMVQPLVISHQINALLSGDVSRCHGFMCRFGTF